MSQTASLPPAVPRAASASVAGYAATVTYLLLKLLRAPREQAVALLDGMRLDGMPLPDCPVGPREITASLGRAVSELQADRPDAAVALVAGAADRWIALVEAGRMEEAVRVLGDAVFDRLDEPGFELAAVLEVLAGAAVLATEGRLTDGPSQARIRLFAQTDGLFQDLVHWFATARPASSTRAEAVGAEAVGNEARTEAGPDLLGTGDPERLRHLLDTVETDGYWLSDRRLDPAFCDRVAAYAATAPARVVPPEAGSPAPAPVDLANPEAEGFNILPQAVFDHPELRALLRDPSLRAVAAARLGCEPVLAMTAMRWSLPNPAGPSTELAQLHHWDAGWNRWINIFFYLTDVGPGHGPHVYVRGTHRRGAKPEHLLRRGYVRVSDAEIEALYPARDIVTLTGSRGSIFVGDTRCWHKGTPLTEGRRLTLQVIFADSLVAAPSMPRIRIRRDYDRPFLDFVASHPAMFPPQYYEIES